MCSSTCCAESSKNFHRGCTFLLPSSFLNTFLFDFYIRIWIIQEIAISLQPLQKSIAVQYARKARMAESVDALVSNTNVRKDVPVRPRLRVPKTLVECFLRGFFCFLSPHFPHTKENTKIQRLANFTTSNPSFRISTSLFHQHGPMIKPKLEDLY